MVETAMGARPEIDSLFTPAVRELVALGAALACNCEPCLRHHYKEAKRLGVGGDDIQAALAMAAMVKQTPSRNAQRLADRLCGCTTDSELI